MQLNKKGNEKVSWAIAGAQKTFRRVKRSWITSRGFQGAVLRAGMWILPFKCQLLWLDVKPKNSCTGLDRCTIILYSPRVSGDILWVVVLVLYFILFLNEAYSQHFKCAHPTTAPQPGHLSAWIVARENHIHHIPQRKRKQWPQGDTCWWMRKGE